MLIGSIQSAVYWKTWNVIIKNNEYIISDSILKVCDKHWRQ